MPSHWIGVRLFQPRRCLHFGVLKQHLRRGGASQSDSLRLPQHPWICSKPWWTYYKEEQHNHKIHKISKRPFLNRCTLRRFPAYFIWFKHLDPLKSIPSRHPTLAVVAAMHLRDIQEVSLMKGLRGVDQLTSGQALHIRTPSHRHRLAMERPFKRPGAWSSKRARFNSTSSQVGRAMSSLEGSS